MKRELWQTSLDGAIHDRDEVAMLLNVCASTCAAGFVQEIKVLRSTVLQRDKERAERATLVAQEKLVRGKVSHTRVPALDGNQNARLNCRLKTFLMHRPD